MIFRSAPLFHTQIRPLEAALLIRYLEEAREKETSTYLRGFLSYIADRVLRGPMDEHMSVLSTDSVLEQAEAILADIREHGEPHFWASMEEGTEN